MLVASGWIRDLVTTVRAKIFASFFTLHDSVILSKINKYAKLRKCLIILQVKRPTLFTIEVKHGNGST